MNKNIWIFEPKNDQNCSFLRELILKNMVLKVQFSDHKFCRLNDWRIWQLLFQLSSEHYDNGQNTCDVTKFFYCCLACWYLLSAGPAAARVCDIPDEASEASEAAVSVVCQWAASKSLSWVSWRQVVERKRVKWSSSLGLSVKKEIWQKMCNNHQVRNPFIYTGKTCGHCLFWSGAGLDSEKTIEFFQEFYFQFYDLLPKNV